MNQSTAIRRYAVSMIAACMAFMIVNYFYFQNGVHCYDCFFHYGVPFAYCNEGGFAGGGGYIWSGVIGDGILVIVCGILIVKAWERFATGRSK